MSMQIEKTRFGDVEVTQIVEMSISDLMGMLLPDATPEAVAEIEWLEPPYRTEGNTLNAVSQCFVIRKGKRLFVVDTCIGDDKNVSAFASLANLHLDFLAALEAAGIDRMAVTDVLCTHLHFDHVGWNTYRKDNAWLPTFPNAKYHFAREEYEYWRSHEREFIASDPKTLDAVQGFSFAESIDPVVAAGLVNLIATDTDLGDGFSVVPTPGHSPGHICLVIDAGDKKLVLAGDVMHHPCQIARPHWAAASDYDSKQSTATRRKLFDELSGTEDLMAGTHFPSPSFGTVSRGRPGAYVFKPCACVR